MDPEVCGPNEVYHHANKTDYCLKGCKSGENKTLGSFMVGFMESIHVLCTIYGNGR